MTARQIRYRILKHPIIVNTVAGILIIVITASVTLLFSSYKAIEKVATLEAQSKATTLLLEDQILQNARIWTKLQDLAKSMDDRCRTDEEFREMQNKNMDRVIEMLRGK